MQCFTFSNIKSEKYNAVNIFKNHQTYTPCTCIPLVRWKSEQPCRCLLPIACYMAIKILVCTPQPGFLQSITSLELTSPLLMALNTYQRTLFNTLFQDDIADNPEASRQPTAHQDRATANPFGSRLDDLIKRSHLSLVQISLRGKDLETMDLGNELNHMEPNRKPKQPRCLITTLCRRCLQWQRPEKGLGCKCQLKTAQWKLFHHSDGSLWSMVCLEALDCKQIFWSRSEFNLRKNMMGVVHLIESSLAHHRVYLRARILGHRLLCLDSHSHIGSILEEPPTLSPCNGWFTMKDVCWHAPTSFRCHFVA